MYHWVSATCGKEALPVDGKLPEGLDVAEAIRCLCTGNCSKEAILMNFPVLQIASFDFSCTVLDVCPLILRSFNGRIHFLGRRCQTCIGSKFGPSASAVQSTLVSKGSIPKIGWVSQWRYMIWKKCHSFTDYIHMKYSHEYCKYIYLYTCKYKHYRCIFQGRQGLLVGYVYVQQPANRSVRTLHGPNSISINNGGFLLTSFSPMFRSPKWSQNFHLEKCLLTQIDTIWRHVSQNLRY